MVSSPSLIMVTMMGLEATARLDTLSPSDYLTLAIDCKDSRIQVSPSIIDGSPLSFWLLF